MSTSITPTPSRINKRNDCKRSEQSMNLNWAISRPTILTSHSLPHFFSTSSTTVTSQLRSSDSYIPLTLCPIPYQSYLLLAYLRLPHSPLWIWAEQTWSCAFLCGSPRSRWNESAAGLESCNIQGSSHQLCMYSARGTKELGRLTISFETEVPTRETI